MNWFLYDRNLLHERVYLLLQLQNVIQRMMPLVLVILAKNILNVEVFQDIFGHFQDLSGCVFS